MGANPTQANALSLCSRTGSKTILLYKEYSVLTKMLIIKQGTEAQACEYKRCVRFPFEEMHYLISLLW